MAQQQVPLLYRVVLLHATVIGIVVAIMQLGSMIPSLTQSNIAMPPINQESPLRAPLSQPRTLMIPRINIQTSIVPGRYISSQAAWELSDDKAHYILNTSPNLTLIYGHNTPRVFELTNSLQVGDTLKLTMTNGETLTYRYVSDSITTPNDTSVLTAAYTKPTVALLTCNGFWSQDRRFMFFEPTEGAL